MEAGEGQDKGGSQGPTFCFVGDDFSLCPYMVEEKNIVLSAPSKGTDTILRLPPIMT